MVHLNFRLMTINVYTLEWRRLVNSTHPEKNNNSNKKELQLHYYLILFINVVVARISNVDVSFSILRYYFFILSRIVSYTNSCDATFDTFFYKPI